MLRLARAAGVLLLAAGGSALGLFACGAFATDATWTADGGLDGSTPPDGEAGAPPDAPEAVLDAATCDTTAAFGAPQPLDVTVNSGLGDYGAWLTADEKTIFFSTLREDSVVRIYKGTRASRTAMFDSVAPLPVSAHNKYEERPTFTPSGDVLVFSRAATYPRDLYVATAGGGEFTAWNLANANSAGDDAEPYLSSDGTSLLFTSKREGSYINRIYRAAFGGADAGPPVLIDELSAGGSAFAPVLSADGNSIYFSSDRDTPGSSAIYVSTKKTGGTFGEPVLVPTINASPAMDDRPNWISPDGCRLYMHSTRGDGRSRVYVAAKP